MYVLFMIFPNIVESIYDKGVFSGFSGKNLTKNRV